MCCKGGRLGQAGLDDDNDDEELIKTTKTRRTKCEREMGPCAGWRCERERQRGAEDNKDKEGVRVCAWGDGLLWMKRESVVAGVAYWCCGTQIDHRPPRKPGRIGGSANHGDKNSRDWTPGGKGLHCNSAQNCQGNEDHPERDIGVWWWDST